jgi:hypothetical protein
MSSEPKEKEPRYAFSFSLESPSKRTPPVSPTEPLWRELPIYKVFYISLKFLIKIPLDKEICPFSQRP